MINYDYYTFTESSLTTVQFSSTLNKLFYTQVHSTFYHSRVITTTIRLIVFVARNSGKTSTPVYTPYDLKKKKGYRRRP